MAKKAKTLSDVKRLLAKHKGEVLKLDVGCGDNKEQEAGWIGMDIEPFEVVDVVHDIEIQPWPFPDETFTLLSSSHVLEHIDARKKGLIRIMDEAWRVLKFGGQFRISFPHAGSLGFWSDPTHINGMTPRTFSYFDPMHPANLYRVYEPKPWHFQQCFWSPEGNVELLMAKRRDDTSYHKFHPYRKK